MHPLKLNWMRRFRLAAGLAFLAISGCSSVDHLQADGVPTILDLHGVEQAFGLAKYNVTSISDINRDVQGITNEKLLPTPLVTGHADDWRWTFYGTDNSRASVLSFEQPRTVTADSSGVRHVIAIPTWDAAMSRFKAVIRAIIGDSAPLLQLQLAFYGENTPVRTSTTLHSDDGIPLYFAFSTPQYLSQGGTASYVWLTSTLELISHEYWHAYNMHHDSSHYVNEMTEEITAYTIQNCTTLALLNGQGGLELHDLGGGLVDLSRLEELRRKQIATGGPAELSNKARLVAIYNIAHLINANTVKRGDIQTDEKIYGLCFAMVHHPVDLTNDFYPSDDVKHLNFQ